MLDPRTAEVARLAAAEVAARAEIKRYSGAIRDRSDPNDPARLAWQDALARWHGALDRLYPAAFWADVTALKQARHRDAATGAWAWSPAPAESIETAIRFLEANLACFRSGYVKERLIRHLVRQPLDEDALGRLRKVVLSALERPARREFRAFCRLAGRVADAELCGRIGEMAKSAEPDRARRAVWMSKAISEGRSAATGRQRQPPRR